MLCQRNLYQWWNSENCQPAKSLLAQAFTEITMFRTGGASNVTRAYKCLWRNIASSRQANERRRRAESMNDEGLTRCIPRWYENCSVCCFCLQMNANKLSSPSLVWYANRVPIVAFGVKSSDLLRVHKGGWRPGNVTWFWIILNKEDTNSRKYCLHFFFAPIQHPFCGIFPRFLVIF